MSTEELTRQIEEVKTTLSALTEENESLRTLINKAASPEEAAKLSLGLAFTLNSLFYSMLRIQGSRGQSVLVDHPVLEQIQHVKERYIKLNATTKKAEKDAQTQSRMKLDKEVTERLIKHAIGSQAELDEIKRQERAE